MFVTQRTSIVGIITMLLIIAGTQAQETPVTQLILFGAAIYNIYTILLSGERSKKEDKVLKDIHDNGFKEEKRKYAK